MSPAIRVAASEADLLAVARALAGQVAFASLEPLVRGGRVLAPRFSSPALRLVEDSLARALVLALARRGGARPRRFLAGGEPGPLGRLWERHAAPALRVSPASLELLRWLVTSRGEAALAEQVMTIADELLLVLALDGLAPLGLADRLAAQPFTRSSPLAQLYRAEAAVDFARLTRGEGALVLEAVSPDLARRWTLRAQDKRALRDPGLVRVRGEAERAVLDAFMDAVDRAGRRDLALWIVDAAAPLLARRGGVEAFVGELEPSSPLGERAAARRASAALLRAIVRWQAWDTEHRAVGFVDDGYHAAQLLLAGFEPVGESGAGHARHILAELDGLGLSMSTKEPSE